MRLPVILLSVFIALSFFYYFKQKQKIRREERRDRLLEKQQELLEALRNKKSEGPSQQ